MSLVSSHSRRWGGLVAAVLGCASVSVVGTAFVYVTAAGATDGAVAMVVGAVLLTGTLPLLRHLVRREPTAVRRVVLLALVVHLLAALVYAAVITGTYGGSDANAYYRAGSQVADQLRQFDFGVSFTTGTRFVELVTGAIYAVIGSSLLGGGLVFAWLSFWGLYLFWRAFALAVPEGHRARYTLVVLFMPSLVFWPATIGKDAWMLLALGVSAWGMARFLTQRTGGLVAFALGVTGTALVRPHVAALLAVAAGAAAVVVPRGGAAAGTGRRRPAAWLALAAIVVAATGIVAGQVGAKFEVSEPLSTAGIEAILEQTERATEIGGSQFNAGPVTNPVNIPIAIATVLFRPFPWEAANVQSLLASLEGLLLLGLLWRWRTAFPRLVPRMRQRPYLAFAAAFTIAFVFAFGSIGNFGILVRQRTQMLPFLFALLAAGTSAWSRLKSNGVSARDTRVGPKASSRLGSPVSP